MNEIQVTEGLCGLKLARTKCCKGRGSPAQTERQDRESSKKGKDAQCDRPKNQERAAGVRDPAEVTNVADRAAEGDPRATGEAKRWAPCPGTCET